MKAKSAQVQSELANEIEAIQIRQSIAKLDSSVYRAAQLQKANNTKLDAILDYLEKDVGIIIRAVYGYGTIPGKLLTLARSIMYSKIDQKTDALAFTGLDEQMIENIIEAFGNTSYFSKEAVAIVGGVECNIAKTKELLQDMAVELGLVNVDLSKINIKTVEYQYISADIRAQTMLENTLANMGQDAVQYEE